MLFKKKRFLYLQFNKNMIELYVLEKLQIGGLKLWQENVTQQEKKE